MKRRIITGGTTLIAGMIIYNAIYTYFEERNMARAEIIRKQQLMHGAIPLSEDKKKILQRADIYERQHWGNHLRLMVKQKGDTELQLKKLLQRKRMEAKQEGNQDQIERITEEEKQLQQLYSASRSHKIVNWQEIYN